MGSSGSGSRADGGQPLPKAAVPLPLRNKSSASGEEALAFASRLGLAGILALTLSPPAFADDYDDALRCVVLIGQAKEAYTAQNVDALREAGDRLQQRADAARPPDLTDQQKIDRLTAVIDAINEEGGIANEWLRGEAVFCGDLVEVSLSLPAGE